MSKAKTSFKGVLFLLLIILIVGGAVFAIFFWPKKPESIKSSLNEQISTVLKTDGEFLSNYQTYGKYSTAYLETDSNAYNKYSTVLTVFNSLSEYFEYMAFVFENADFATYEIGDINEANSQMGQARDDIQNVANYLKEKNQSLTKDGYNTREYEVTDAQLVWQNIEVEIKNAFVHYQTATDCIAKVYRTNITKGVYANEFANQVATGVGYYLNYFVSSFDTLGQASYKLMSINFLNFVNNYISNQVGQRNVANFLTSQTLQDTAEVLAKYGEKITDLTQKDLLLNSFTYDETKYNEEQLKTLSTATNFYKGGVVA